MRVCPKCGHRDSEIWHSYRWLFDADTCRFDEFVREYPHLADLKLGQVVADDHYFYRRTTRNGLYIRRWEKELGPTYEKDAHSILERRHVFKNPNQTRLLMSEEGLKTK